MESLAFTSKTSFLTSTSLLPWLSPSNRRTTTTTRTTRIVCLNKKKISQAFAKQLTREERDKIRSQLNKDDLVEVEMGRLLGEDPDLTLAKIMGRKADLGVSYLDIEKAYYNRGRGKVVEIKELPFEVELPWWKKSPPEPQLKPGDDDDKNVAMEIKKPSFTPSKPGDVRKSSVPSVILRKPSLNKKGEVEEVDMSSRLMLKPNLTLKTQSGGQMKDKFSDMTLLRKPGLSIGKYREGDLNARKEEPKDEVGRLNLLKPNLTLKTQSGQVKEEKFSDVTLLRKPGLSTGKYRDGDLNSRKEEPRDEVGRLSLLKQPHRPSCNKELETFVEPRDEVGRLSLLKQPHRPSCNKELETFVEPRDEVKLTLLEQPHRPSDEVTNLSLLEQPHRPSGKVEQEKSEKPSDEVAKLTLLEQPHKPSGKIEQEKFEDPSDEIAKLNLLEQPHRPSEKIEQEQSREPRDEVKKVILLEQPHRPSDKDEEQFGDARVVVPNDGTEQDEQRQTVVHQEPIDIQEGEDADWTKVDNLIKNGNRDDVELISCSAKGFVVSFGTLVGFLPYRNLLPKWKFLAFESWLRQKGLDPSMYKQNLVTVTHNDAENNNVSSDSPSLTENNSKFEDKLSPDMKLEDLLRIYDQEKINFLSLFVGQKTKAYVLLADRKLKKLIFSLIPKENEELTEKRRNLMARLQVGDIVKCRVQKITYFGIFVEVEGVSALIHQSEISWDEKLDPSKFFEIDQVVEAKVHQINFGLGRIFLSLKEVTPDPLMESLESVVGDHESFDGRLEAAQTDAEWSEVESLIKELKKIEGVQSVSKGRIFRSPGLAPTFQVYMASIFEDQYKLLARSGNRIQEVMVQTVLDKEMMKSAIMTCASRVE